MPEPIVTPGPGVYPGTPMAGYHGWDAASNSRLGRLAKSPAHLRAYMDAPSKDTDALRLGRAIHCAILEPDDFPSRYALAEQCAAPKKDGTRCSNPGLFIHREIGWVCGVHVKGWGNGVSTETETLSPEDHAICMGLRDSAYRSETVRSLLTGSGEVELSMLWEEATSGVLCKARWDRHSPDLPGGVIVDLKTTRSALRRDFERTIFGLRYHCQGGLYLDSARARKLPARHYVIIAAEKEPPFAVAPYRLTEGATDAGMDQLRPLLQLYRRCQESGEWPAYPDVVQDIGLPDWAWRQVAEDIALQEEIAA